MANKKSLNLFCTRCFASEDNSSWGGEVIPSRCFNCGAGGFVIEIPKWAIDSIRKNASWVGKRYYPSQEDFETAQELKKLRASVSSFNGRSAKQTSYDPSQWIVSQILSGDTSTSIVVSASSEKEALEKAKTLLPYIG
jgi:hypothetical protein